MQQKEEKKIKVFDDIKYEIVPEIIYNSCDGCEVGNANYCKPRNENVSGEQLVCGIERHIYKKLEIILGKKKQLEL